MKAERQVSDKKQENRSALMDDFRIPFEEKHNNDAEGIRGRTRTKSFKKRTNYR